jgi:two-component system, response regulator YesN
VYKILIVDDEQLERDALRAIINKSVDSIIEIEDAVNGREAVAKARSFNPDMIFLDIKMPGINGIEASRMIRESNPSISIIFLTAFNQFEYAHEAIQIGVDDFIIKPSSEKRVLEVVLKVINKIDSQRTALNLRENSTIRLNRATDYLENEFIYTLSVRGITEEKFNSYLSILDVKFYSARAGIVKLLFETYPLNVESDYQKQVLKKRCMYILKSALAKMDILSFFNTDISNLYFLLSQENRESNGLKTPYISSLIEDITKEIKKNLNMKVIIGIGSIFSNPQKALSSFLHAKNDLSRLQNKEKSFLSVQENTTVQFPIHLEIGMEQAVLSGKRKEVMEVFQQICEWFEASPLNFEDKKRDLIELITILKHVAGYQLPNGICLLDDSEIRNAAEAISLLTSFNILLNDLLEQINRSHEVDNSPAIEKVCKFIDNNFNTDITLEEAASQCSLSSFYFSKLFKKSKKVTFIDYLTNCRIEEAKKLLSDTNFSIKEISQHVGYNDPNYFTRVFKRVVSNSPTIYRNNKMLK